MKLIFELTLEAFFDTLKMLPFLFAAYLAMEYLERRPESRLQRMLTQSPAAPVAGGLLGLLPQCGFSAAAANLFNRKLLSAGTLLAVFIATSDEAVPMLLASPGSYPLLLRLTLCKLALAVGCGLLLDWLLPTHAPAENCHCHCCHHEQAGGHDHLLLATLRHTLQIGCFIFGISLALGGVIHLIGAENLTRILMTGSFWQPFAAALVGFIPNCASSILLTQLLIDGSLSFGSALAGLTTGAGAGLLVLLRGSRDRKLLLAFLGLLYGIGVVAGLVANALL